jgi:hypothetical protein
MLPPLVDDPMLSAVACNAYTFQTDRPGKPFISTGSGVIRVHRSRDLINRYLNPWADGACPLSSYIYRTSRLSTQFLDVSKGGKYSDLPFLLCVLDRGPFLWLRQPYSLYRVHASSDNAHFSFRDKLSLIRCITTDYQLPKTSYTYLNAKSIWYRQHFEVQPTLSGLLSFRPRNRRKLAEAFVSRMAVVRIGRSHRYRRQLASSFCRKILSLTRRSGPIS